MLHNLSFQHKNCGVSLCKHGKVRKETVSRTFRNAMQCTKHGSQHGETCCGMGTTCSLSAFPRFSLRNNMQEILLRNAANTVCNVATQLLQRCEHGELQGNINIRYRINMQNREETQK